MNMLRIDVNTRPWAPAEDAKVVFELDRHDVPLAGFLEQAGQRHLFACVVGEMDDTGVWAYVPISPEDEHRLAELEGEAVLAATHAMLENTMVTLAGVVGLKVVYADRIDAGVEGLAGLVERFLNRWQTRVEAHASAVGELVAN